MVTIICEIYGDRNPGEIAKADFDLLSSLQLDTLLTPGRRNGVYSMLMNVDGASDFQLLMRILLPLAKPAIATCVILLFLDTWNEFIYAMIFMQDPTIHTVPVGLAKIGTSRYHINIGTYSASVMITIIPVMFIFAIFQRWFIAGMTMLL